MYYFIINKRACSGRVYRTWKRLRSHLDRDGIIYEECLPESEQACIEMVRTLTGPDAEDVHLVVVGGDGTLNTVLQGIEDLGTATLSLIPAGSGNDFARALKIPKKPGKAFAGIAAGLSSGRAEPIDYGLVTFTEPSGKSRSKRFLISAGTGYDAEICEEADRSPFKDFFNKHRLGKLVYLVIGLEKLVEMNRHVAKSQCSASIIMDDERWIDIDDLFLCTGMNTPYQGGGAPFCPEASWQDGRLDTCVANNMGPVSLLLGISLVYFKKHTLFRQINTDRCRRLDLRLGRPRWLHADGEPLCETDRITIEIRSGLRFVK